MGKRKIMQCSWFENVVGINVKLVGELLGEEEYFKHVGCILLRTLELMTNVVLHRTRQEYKT